MVDCRDSRQLGGGWVIGLHDHERQFAHGRKHDVSEDISHVVRHLAFVDECFHGARQHAERGALLNFSGALPAEHRHRVDENDPLHDGVARQLNPGDTSGSHRRDSVRSARCGVNRRFPDTVLDRLQDCIEERFFAFEVVIERPAAHVGCGKNRLR